MGKIKNYVTDIQEQVWDFYDQDGNFVPKEVSFTDKNGQGKVKILKNKNEMIQVFDMELGPYARTIVEEEVFAIETSDHFS